MVSQRNTIAGAECASKSPRQDARASSETDPDGPTTAACTDSRLPKHACHAKARLHRGVRWQGGWGLWFSSQACAPPQGPSQHKKADPPKWRRPSRHSQTLGGLEAGTCPTLQCSDAAGQHPEPLSHRIHSAHWTPDLVMGAGGWERPDAREFALPSHLRQHPPEMHHGGPCIQEGSCRG